MVATGARERLLIVDDAVDTLEVLERNLSAQGYEVLRAQAVAQAVELLALTPVDLVITDLKMPGASGLELVRHVREKLPDTAVMMITGYASIEGAVEAVKLGAEDYLPKPFTQDELQTAVSRALGKLERRRAERPGAGRPAADVVGLVGRSEPLRRVLEAVVLAAGTGGPVLVSGECGSGKEQVAREIHYRSARARGPFLAVSCGKVPEHLLEGELFGYAAGEPSNRAELEPGRAGPPPRDGLFQLATGGTVYLAQLTDLPLPLQEKLAAALRDRRVTPVGGTQALPVDVRVVAGTTRDLPALVNKGLFREDLLLLLGAIAIALPPLRERGEDVGLLAQHFLGRAARRAGRPVPDLAPAALDALGSYPWPGNVGELRAEMERLVLAGARDPIEVGDLPPLVRASLDRADALNRSLAEVEAEHIRAALASVQGNKTRCARILGIDRKTLREKMKTYEIV
jgi:DNA-binding NtrC family response regulator